MHSSKLLDIIRSIDSDRIRKLERFLHSPYFGPFKQKDKILRLFSYLKNHHPEYPREAMHKEVVYQRLFPKDSYSNDKINRLMGRLLNAIKKFIAVEQSDLLDNEVLLLLSQTAYFREKHLTKPFMRNIDQLNDIQLKQKKRNKDFYFHQYQIEKEVSANHSLYNNRKEDLNLPNTLQSLDLFYLSSKLEYTCWLLAQNLFSVPIDIQANLDSLDTVLQLVQQDPNLNVPIVEVYCKALDMLRNNDDDAFQELKHLLLKYANTIPDEQIRALSSLCRNFCVSQTAQGNKTYLKESFELYQTHLAKGYLYYENQILPSTLQAIVSLGLKMKNYDWVYDFLEQHKGKITGTQYPNEIYNYNLANCFFAQKKYDKALEYLADTYEDTYYKISARRLELKIYYDQKSELLESRMLAFKVYIYRISKKLLPELHRLANNHFIDFLRQINTPTTLNNAKRIEKLSKKIIETNTTADKNWLLEKLEELK